ncbi:uncharacterized protein LOC121790503 isoform X1 [Salvia splendens]|uniref:uncharacterized protein LOC121790503 isoform X1 n=2 Tax=Salvia splendens TaxID=180675 RepID=UPI001C26D683|nr:uncharacterized protein LOC121790503 isoform X1 [Salvia splendens]
MWRRNAAGFGDEARENEDSDQSISEEDEDPDGEWIRNTVSLGGDENDKGNLKVLSQLEILRESFMEESVSSPGRKGAYEIEDEVEPPIFNDRSSPNHYHGIASATLARSNKGLIYLPDISSVSYSDEEIISDYEKIGPGTSKSVRENLAITWSEASREVEALVRSKENPCSSSSHHDVFVKEKKSTRGGGGRRKAKVKFSFPCHSDKPDQSLVVSDSDGGTSSDKILIADEIGDVADDEMHNNMADSQLNIHNKHILPFEMPHNHETRGHSMAEILGGFLERSDLQEESSKLVSLSSINFLLDLQFTFSSTWIQEIQKRRRKQAVFVRNVLPLGDSIQEDNDLPEALDSDNSFETEDEEGAQSIKSVISRTMADQFHEAFRTVSEIDDRLDVSFPRPLCGGMFRRLQQVMQIEKERETDSVKNASAETGFRDEETPISVRILSRSLEAKLILCSCTCVGDGKTFSREARTITIIFNPRMSDSVDLEVSNLIHIRPPWKEVQVKNEVIFLCSHFSQVQP